jgi:CBS-domain-containing membrane protein
MVAIRTPPASRTREVVTVKETDDVKDAARLMKDRQIRRVVVVGNDSRVCGIVSLGDIAVDTQNDKMSGDVLEKVSANSVVPAGQR